MGLGSFSLPSCWVSNDLRDSHAGGQARQVPGNKSGGSLSLPSLPGARGPGLWRDDILRIADQNSGDWPQECGTGAPPGRAALQEPQHSGGTGDRRVQCFLCESGRYAWGAPGVLEGLTSACCTEGPPQVSLHIWAHGSHALWPPGHKRQ